jgi:UDP-N-acetylmuramate dehydrogenase
VKVESPPARWSRAVPLAQLSTWRIGGPARFIAAPDDEEQLRADLDEARQLHLPVLALGGGSNLLFPDSGYDGLVLRLPTRLPSRYREEADRTAPHPRLLLAAGTSLTGSAHRLASLGLRGLEWAEGIPGTIGGAIVNNAGAFGSSIADTLASVRVVLPDGSAEHWEAARLQLRYRDSLLKGHDPTAVFIVAAEFRLNRDDPAKLLQIMRRIRLRREERLPKQPSCGCVFRNPPDVPAGRLIDQLGLGGLRVGGARVSTHHANVIVNEGGARAQDVLELIQRVRAEVAARGGQNLELEIQIVGAPGPAPSATTS